ncbi:hypothetical protein WN51_04843 [Melipona quadrifasciata]|uniref:Uncharacterized protein n=1 Tax=Melipona quadrifasciata TaxID=166423 RepID=A0A0M8ZUW5_9HYME|nr:hypothetical protein WN51_04843 [Melipona quadrifasciata]
MDAQFHGKGGRVGRVLRKSLGRRIVRSEANCRAGYGEARTNGKKKKEKRKKKKGRKRGRKGGKDLAIVFEVGERSRECLSSGSRSVLKI